MYIWTGLPSPHSATLIPESIRPMQRNRNVSTTVLSSAWWWIWETDIPLPPTGKAASEGTMWCWSPFQTRTTPLSWNLRSTIRTRKLRLQIRCRQRWTRSTAWNIRLRWRQRAFRGSGSRSMDLRSKGRQFWSDEIQVSRQSGNWGGKDLNSRGN